MYAHFPLPGEHSSQSPFYKRTLAHPRRKAQTFSVTKQSTITILGAAFAAHGTEEVTNKVTLIHVKLPVQLYLAFPPKAAAAVTKKHRTC